MASQPLRIAEVQQAGDRLTVAFNDGRTLVYSVSMLDSEFEEIQSAVAEAAEQREPVEQMKRQRPKPPRSKRPGSEGHSAGPLRSRKAS
jgi:hypothetical protein